MTDRFGSGCAVKPALMLIDVSSWSGGIPNAWVTPSRLLAVSTRAGSSSPLTGSMTNWMLTLLNQVWCSDGARNPLLIAPRRANSGATSKRAAILPVSVLPKSL